MRRAVHRLLLVVSSLGVAGALAAAGCGDDGGGGADAGADAAPPLADPGEVYWVVPHRLETDYASAIAPDGTILTHGQGQGVPDEPTLLAITPAGEIRWSAHTAVGSISPPGPVIVGDTVLVTASDVGADASTLYRFALADGAPGETTGLVGPTLAGLAVGADGTLFVPAQPLHAIGATSWQFDLDDGGKTGSNAAVGPSGTIYVGARGISNQNLYAVTPAGTEAWKVDLGDAVIAPLAVDADERIYVVSADGVLHVFEANGEPAWSFQFPSHHSSGGVVIGPDGTVYAGTLSSTPSTFDDDWVFAVRDAGGGEGELVWSANVGFGVTSTPALSAGGTLYVADGCRALHALDAATGESKWSLPEPNTPEGMCSGFSAPTIGADGMVYASTEGYPDEPGGTYAVGGDGTGPAASAWPIESGDAAHHGRVE